MASTDPTADTPLGYKLIHSHTKTKQTVPPDSYYYLHNRTAVCVQRQILQLFTHYHFDHCVGYADLLARGYQTRTPSKLDSLDVWGPPGLQEITDGLLGGLAVGAVLHNWNPSRPNLPTVPNVHEFDLPETGVELVYDDENVLLRATRVDHDVDVPNAYDYRFDIISGPSAGKSVVFSGDTKKNDQLIALAMDATILVHEVQKTEWAANIAPPGSPLYEHLINSHTDVSEIPEIAKEANVGMVVLCHYGNIDASYTLAQAAAILFKDVMKANAEVGYKGRIIAPHELDVIGLKQPPGRHHRRN